MVAMKGIVVQARLDEEAQRALGRLVRRLRWTPSKVVREGIRLLAASHPGSGRPKIAGLGKFSSGRTDLGSNKKHLQGFGE
jgi:hypothetical protein